MRAGAAGVEPADPGVRSAGEQQPGVGEPGEREVGRVARLTGRLRLAVGPDPRPRRRRVATIRGSLGHQCHLHVPHPVAHSTAAGGCPAARSALRIRPIAATDGPRRTRGRPSEPPRSHPDRTADGTIEPPSIRDVRACTGAPRAPAYGPGAIPEVLVRPSVVRRPPPTVPCARPGPGVTADGTTGAPITSRDQGTVGEVPWSARGERCAAA